MKLVVRTDGITLNLNAVLFFTPRGNDLIVEMPGSQFFIIPKMTFFDLTVDDRKVFYKEFKGWPDK
jgi:hypothetical protein